MSRAGVYTTMPPEELQRKIAKAREQLPTKSHDSSNVRTVNTILL